MGIETEPWLQVSSLSFNFKKSSWFLVSGFLFLVQLYPVISIALVVIPAVFKPESIVSRGFPGTRPSPG